MKSLIDPVIALAEDAGRAILKVYASDFDVQSKDDDSPLTQADLASNRCIVAGLKSLAPEIPIISEESGLPEFDVRSRWDRYWLIDPLGSTTSIRVSAASASPVRVVGSRSHRGASLDAYLANLGECDMVPMGSSLKFCVVAEGGADLYPRLGPTSEWDTAAAQAVVEQAGGSVVTLDGKPMKYNTKENILNPYFFVVGPSDKDWLALLPDTE